MTVEEKLKQIKELVDKQVNDEGLWFIAKTAPEAYLQQELRKLHALIEEDIKIEDVFIIESGSGYFLGFINDIPQMTTDPVIAKRFTLKATKSIMEHLNKIGFDAELVRLRLGKINNIETVKGGL